MKELGKARASSRSARSRSSSPLRRRHGHRGPVDGRHAGSGQRGTAERGSGQRGSASQAAAGSYTIGFSNAGGVGNGFREEQVCTAQGRGARLGQGRARST